MAVEINRSQPDSDRPMTPSEQAAYERGYADAEQATIDFMLTSQRDAAEIPQQLPQRTRKSIISLFTKNEPQETTTQESNNTNASRWNRILGMKLTRRAALTGGLVAAAGVGHFAPRIISGAIKDRPSVAQAEEILFGPDPSDSVAMQASSSEKEVLPPSPPTSSESEIEATTETDAPTEDEHGRKIDLSKMKKDVFESLNLPFYIDKDTLWFTEDDLKGLLKDQLESTAVGLSISYSVGEVEQTGQYTSGMKQHSVLIKDPPTLFVKSDSIANYALFLPEIETPYGKLYGIKGFDLGNQTLVAEFADFERVGYTQKNSGEEEKRFIKPIQLQNIAEFPAMTVLPHVEDNQLQIIDHAQTDPSILKNDIYTLANDFNAVFPTPHIWRIIITDEIPRVEPISVQESDKKVLFVHASEFPPDGSIRIDKPGVLKLCSRLVDMLLDPQQPHFRAIESTLSSLNTAYSAETDAYNNDKKSASNPQQSTPVAHFPKELLKKEKINLPNYVDTMDIADYGVYLSARIFLREFIPLVRYKPQQVRDYVEALDPAQQETAKSYMANAFTVIRQIAHSYYPNPASAEEAFHSLVGRGITKELIQFATKSRIHS